MSKRHSSRGFTLLELLIVIIILGFLSVFAAQEYLNITKEAKIAATKGKLAAIRGGIELAHAKIMASGVNTGPDGDNPDWPTLEEIQFNELRLETRPESLRHLRLVRSDQFSNQQDQALPECSLPDMTPAMSRNPSAVASMSLEDVQNPVRNGNESTCWAYYPGDERDANGRIFPAVFYINDDRPIMENQDAAGKRPSQW